MKKRLGNRIFAALIGIATVAVLMTGCASESVNSDTSVVDSGASVVDSTVDTSETAQTGFRVMRDISSVELVKEMKIGWNLGNTFDGGGEEHRGKHSALIETAWGNPCTTKAMIDEVVKAGFNVIRIPATWEWSIGEAPDYKISDEWMNRIQEVVDYAIDNDVFVIINLHHDKWYNPAEENYEAASDKLKKVWTQIGTHFADYNEKLLFEGMNEPRLIGSGEEWTGGSPETKEIVNKLNADFVATIRGLGGNNKLRHLLIPGYSAGHTVSVFKYMKVPENDDKVIVSVHAYAPYNFTLNPSGTDEWDVTDEEDRYEIDKVASGLKKYFIDNGIPVIIGEFGAIERDNLDDRSDWVQYYITKMKQLGVPCLWWDNGTFNSDGEKLGLLDRKNVKFRHELFLEAMMTAVNTDIDIEAMINAEE